MIVPSHNELPNWVSYLQAFSTPAIAIAGIAIAWGQLRLANNKYESEFYERRLAIYNATRQLIDSLLNKEPHKEPKLYYLALFNKVASEFVFIFNQDVVTYLEEIREKAYQYWLLDNRFSRLYTSDPNYESNMQEERELIAWLEHTSEIMIVKFKPYLAPRRRWRDRIVQFSRRSARKPI